MFSTADRARQYDPRTAFAVHSAKYFGTSEYFFRVYDDDGTFADYDLRHDDLNVTIDIDSFASFYNAGDRGVLDHSPSVLGLKSADETP